MGRCCTHNSRFSRIGVEEAKGANDQVRLEIVLVSDGSFEPSRPKVEVKFLNASLAGLRKDARPCQFQARSCKFFLTAQVCILWGVRIYFCFFILFSFIFVFFIFFHLISRRLHVDILVAWDHGMERVTHTCLGKEQCGMR